MIELNKCYCMDNLELMKQIEDGSVDLIYCDILYGTGKDFGDYQDLKYDKEIIYGFYIPRIKEMHRVLSSTGSIYLQCDWRINHWIRNICDDIFGFKNCFNEIIWKSYHGSKNNCKNNFFIQHNNIYCYQKTNIKKFNPQYLSLDEKYIKKEFKFEDENGRKYRKARRSKNSKYQVQNDIYYLDESNGVLISSLWEDICHVVSNSKEYTKYNTQKPKALLERIIKASSNEGDVVADFFCGSGVTGIVAKELNRNYILCDINPRAIEISEERLK